ncbi:MAG TPA: 30S ribosomal protein S12 methylthiotransferase RimO [Firmicutes bacterium]|nr:30S ribosomal protein S12 methylthiotransferase RimO [Bacillota bacterium]
MAIKIGMVSLGCSKNQVDAEIMLSLLCQGGYELCADPSQCQVVIVNTCGFIEDAKRESIETILEFCQMKEQGLLKAVVVTGCLAERYREEMAVQIPEVDVILGIGKNSEIVAAVRRALEGERVVDSGPKGDLPLEGERVLTTPGYFAYLKIAEGCDNCCTYCAIPLIRGRFRSRPMETIVEEARRLIAGGVQEINLIAQDTSRYGEDLYGTYSLAELLTRLCRLEGLRWLRVLYCYPDHLTDQLLEVMAREEKIVKYIDIPLQHCSGPVLKAMNRTGDRESLLRLMAHVREKIPGVTLRTTLIAGFPGETEEDFEELCRFVKEARFERLGCFAYSQEEGTPAALLPGQLDEEEKRRRAEIVMNEQMPIAFQVSASQVGKTLPVLVEGMDEETGLYCGRSPMDAPDIDTRVLFTSGRPCREGEFVQVEITGTEGYDLTGRAC